MTTTNTNDVFGSWREHRYIVADTELRDDPNRILIVLTDVKYWVDNYEQLEEWCHGNQAVVKGMTVECSDAALVTFILRWS